MIDAYLSRIVDELAAARADIRTLAGEVAALRAATPPRLVSVPEAARMLGVSPATAWRRVRDGELLVRRIGRSVRIDAADLRAPSRESIAALANAARAG
jgi:excisionase family DNA binding protein